MVRLRSPNVGGIPGQISSATSSYFAIPGPLLDAVSGLTVPAWIVEKWFVNSLE